MDIEQLGNQILRLQDAIAATPPEFEKLSRYPADVAALLGDLHLVLDVLDSRGRENPEAIAGHHFLLHTAKLDLERAQMALQRVAEDWRS